jgi:hypothetical protein
MEQCLFWEETLKRFCRNKQHQLQGSRSYNEYTFYKGRAIQFMDAFLEQYSVPSKQHVDATQSVEATEELRRPVTRRQRQDSLSEMQSSPPTSPKKCRGRKSISADLVRNKQEDRLSCAWTIVKILVAHCLTDESRQIRELALNCLHRLKLELKMKHAVVSFMDFIEEYKNEILMDNEYVLPKSFFNSILSLY